MLWCCTCRYVWESKADGSFAISEDTWNEPLGRGTEIRLHLRDEAKEYLEEDKLKVLPYYLLSLLVRLIGFCCKYIMCTKFAVAVSVSVFQLVSPIVYESVYFNRVRHE